MKKFIKITIIFLIITSWIFSGWPRIWQNPPIPPKIKEVKATVGFDAFSSGAAGTGNLSWTHTPAGTPKAVIVLIAQNVGTTNEISNVTYGSLSLTKVAGPVCDTSGEPGCVYAYFGGSSIPTGNQTVTVNVSGSSTKRAGSITLTGSGSTYVVTYDASITSDAKNPTITLNLNNQTSFVAEVFHSGQNDPANITPFSGWTARLEHDYGSQTAGWYTYDTVNSTNVSAGWTQNSEDAAMIALAVSEITTTLGNGTDPSNSTNGPGTTNYLDQFSFVTNSGTDTVTGLTVTTANTSAIASIKICSNDDNCATQYFNTVTSPSGDNWNFSGGTSIPVTTTTSYYRVVFTAKDHSSLAEGTYAVTGYVSAFTCSNNQAGSDSAGTTITIDNAPPSNATWGTITPGDQQIALNWSNPGSDFYKVLILRKAGSSITDAPTDGTEYSVPGTIGNSTIIYVNNGTSFTDTGLTNGTDYYYKIFAYDQYKNYASGSGTGPHQPVAVSISLTTDGSISFGTLEFNETRDTTPSDLNDPETVKVDSGPADLEIKTTIFSGGGNNWSLGTSNGSEQVKWEFQKSGSSWTTFETNDYLYVLENNVPQGESRTIYFRLTTPTSTVSSADHSATITIVASPPD